MKYIDAEKLKYEIERLEHENCMNGGEHFCMRRAICLGNLRNIINPLYHEQQEQPEVDIEKEIGIYFQGWTNCDDYSQALNAEGECVCVEEIIDIARRFFNLGLNARK